MPRFVLRSLELRIEGDAYERDPRSHKCTLVSPYSKRHLRHVTPGTATPRLRLFGCDNLPQQYRDLVAQDRRPSTSQYTNALTSHQAVAPQAAEPSEGSSAAASTAQHQDHASPYTYSYSELARPKRGKMAGDSVLPGGAVETYMLKSHGEVLPAGTDVSGYDVAPWDPEYQADTGEALTPTGRVLDLFAAQWPPHFVSSAGSTGIALYVVCCPNALCNY